MKPYLNRHFDINLDDVCPGDVVSWYYTSLEKSKYHLFLTWEGDYIYLNTPKDRRYPYDLLIGNDKVPFLPPTSSGLSAACCANVMTVPDKCSFRARSPKPMGNIDTATLLAILVHIERLKSTEPRVAVRISDTIRTLASFHQSAC